MNFILSIKPVLMASVIIELFIAIYYFGSTLEYKDSRRKSNLIALLGYTMYLVLCMFQNPLMNIAGFICVNFFVLYFGFEERINSIILRVMILTGLMMFGEMTSAFFIDENITHEFRENITFIEDIIFSMSSKIIYFLSVIMFKRLSPSRKAVVGTWKIIWVFILPVSTCFFLSLFNRLKPILDHSTETAFVVLSIMLIITNFVVYIVYDKLIDNLTEIQHLQNIKHKREIDFKSYELIKEKYDELRIMVHDFSKYCKNIEGMLDENQSEAISLIRQMENKNKEFLLVEYTTNRALNILLSQKMKQCNDEGIDFQIYVQDIDISFISEMDIVSIFSNLIDNAVESCRMSTNKKIFLKIYNMNDSYIVINMDNNSDNEPLMSAGQLHTRKQNKNMHGIGMESIKRTLKNYDGRIKWTYDKENKIFSTTIMINYYRTSKVNLTNVAIYEPMLQK